MLVMPKAVRDARGGWDKRICLLAALHRQAMSATELAEWLGVPDCSVGTAIRGLRGLGWVHRAGWRVLERCVVPLWRLGPGVDAPPPPEALAMPGACARALAGWRPQAPTVPWAVLVDVLRLLQAGPLTVPELAVLVGYGSQRVRGWLRLMADMGLARETGWTRERDVGRWLPHYGFGDGRRRVPKPALKPKTQVKRDYRARQAQRDAAQAAVNDQLAVLSALCGRGLAVPARALADGGVR